MDVETPSTSNEENYGEATYAMSRHRKNKILVWKSKKQEGKVYEFTLATRFKMAGVFSWRCLQCSLVRDKMKRMGHSVKDRKVPLLLVDNDIIKEDPDRPNNAAHFCDGRDLAESAVLRSKLMFYEAHEKTHSEPKDVIDEFVEDAPNTAPFQLTAIQRRSVQRYVSEKVIRGSMKKTLLRRRKSVGLKKTEKPHIVHEKFVFSSFPRAIQRTSRSSNDCNSGKYSDEIDEIIDVEGDAEAINNVENRKFCDSV